MDTHVLIVSESDDAHVSFITERMTQTGKGWHWIRTDKVGTNTITWTINSCEQINKEHLSDISTVWYRKRHQELYKPIGAAESFTQQENEGLLAGILSQYKNCRWINSPEQITVARSKIGQLSSASALGFTVPETLVSNDLQSLQKFYTKHCGNIIIKPIQAQVIQDGEVSVSIGTRRIAWKELAQAVMQTACLAQERLEIDTEVRVIAFGKKLFAFSMKTSVPYEDIKQVSTADIKHSTFNVDSKTRRRIQLLMSEYSLHFAALDFVVTKDGRLVFLEMNPNGQWLWLQFVTGINLTDPFIDFLQQET